MAIFPVIVTANVGRYLLSVSLAVCVMPIVPSCEYEPNRNSLFGTSIFMFKYVATFGGIHGIFDMLSRPQCVLGDVCSRSCTALVG